MRIFLLPLLVFLIAGCTISHEKLAAYVGQDVQAVVADYGNPNVGFDMDDGRRDFQWTMNMSSPMPVRTISTGALTSPANLFDPDIKVTPIIPLYGGQAVAAECSYTLVTHWNESRKTWIVTAYQKPVSGC